MKNIFVKFISCFVFCAIILGVPAMSPVRAYVCPHCDCCCCGSEVHVSDENGLRYALEEACCGTVIVLDADIYLDDPVYISPCVTVCKNGYRLMESYKIEHHGYYAVEPVVLYPNIVVYEDVWHPTWIETGYHEVF